MARSLERACRHYRMSLSSGASRRWDDDQEAQVRHYRQGMELVRMAEARVRRVVLAREGNPARLSCYANFGRRLVGLGRRYAGKTLVLQCRLAVELWEAKGLSREVLEEVCHELLNLG